jgi:hypothetical protein
MGIYKETGFALAPGDQPLTHARILHAGNWLQPTTAESSSTAPGFVADGPLGNTTHLRWSPWANLVASARDLSVAPWSVTNATVLGGRLIETTANGVHRATQNVTLTTGSHMVEAEVRAAGRFIVQLWCRGPLADAASDHIATFSLATGAITFQQNLLAGAGAVALEDGWWRLRMPISALAGVRAVQVRLANAAGLFSYAGDGVSGVEVRKVAVVRASSTYRVRFGAARPFDAICIGRHNLGSAGASVTAKWLNDATNAFIDMVTFAPADDSPIWIMGQPRAASAVEIAIFGAGEAWLSNVKVGTALQMPVRANYGGVSPLRLARDDVVRSQESATGEYLGRTIQRVALRSEFTFEHLPKAWVDTHWPRLQAGLRRAPYYIAWRPETHDEVGFVQTNDAPVPSTMGVNAYLSATIPVTGVGYE